MAIIIPVFVKKLKVRDMLLGMDWAFNYQIIIIIIIISFLVWILIKNFLNSNSIE
jgi:hypothetical protein